MSVVTYEELAKLIDGHNQEDQLTKYVMKIARDNHLIIVSAIGDDTISFDGAFHDEADLFRGGDIYIAEDGVYTRPGQDRVKINVFWENNGLCVVCNDYNKICDIIRKYFEAEDSLEEYTDPIPED